MRLEKAKYPTFPCISYHQLSRRAIISACGNPRAQKRVLKERSFAAEQMRSLTFRCAGLLAMVLLACSCNGGHYHSRVAKLHSGMSREEVVAVLGKPYGEATGMIVYYDAGADTILAVQPSEYGATGWVLLEVPQSGISERFAYYKVRDSSGSGQVAIGMTIRRVP